MNSVEFGSYAAMLCDPANADWKAPQYAEALGVSTTTIYRWDKKVDWDWVKSERRKQFARPTSEIDNALFRQARKGDVQAIRTWYERFDSWTPETKLKTEHSVSDGEVDQALNELIERKRAAVAALDASGRVANSPAVAGEVAPTEGGAATVLPAQSSAEPLPVGDSQAGGIHNLERGR